MKEIKNTKKSKIIKVAALLGLFLFVFGISYALFTVVLNGTKRNRITTGNLGLTLTDINGNIEPEGLAINLENTVPITDEEGVETEAYQFVVTNTGTIPASYKLHLVDDGVNTLKDEYIKYDLEGKFYLKKSDNNYYQGGVFNTEAKLLNTGRKLDEITLLPGQKIEYKLNLWLDYDAGNEAMEKEFNGKIQINGTQAMIYDKGILGENIEYNYYQNGTIIITGNGEYDDPNNYVNQDGDIVDLGKLMVLYPGLKRIYKDTETVFNYDSMENNNNKIYIPLILQNIANNMDEETSEKINTCINTVTDEEAAVKCNDNSENVVGNIMYLHELIQDWDNVRKLLKTTKNIPPVYNIIMTENIKKIAPFIKEKLFLKANLVLPSTIETFQDISWSDFGSYGLVIPPQVNPDSIFLNHSLIRELVIPGTFKILPSFKDNFNLKKIVIQEGVETIKSNTFSENEGLKIYIPNSVKKIEKNMFIHGYGKIYIEIDNSREFVEANWDSGWDAPSATDHHPDITVKYLR